jgi:CHAT domain-containing protein
MDLLYVNQPLMVGHYEGDPIAGAEALIDRDMVGGELSIRNGLGLYAGARGSAAVVLMSRNSAELHQGSCRGAVVIGLGKLGELSFVALTEAVRVGTLRYLLQILDRAEGARQDTATVGLSSLLIGQNSTNEIQIHDSVSALVEGVLAANEQFARAFPKVPLQVETLQLVEIYLDTAITATRTLKSLEKKHGAKLSVASGLRFGKGWRHRLDAAQATGYWPRLIVTNAAIEQPPDDPQDGRPGVQLASQLSFSFLGERARAETLQQQRQSGLVEKLVEGSIHNPDTNEDLSRTLFQLLVPSAFKELARDLDQLVLVLDDTTANLPWELLRADSEPMALSLAMVRQLQAPRFRQRVRQATSRSAYVIGNPKSDGFYTVFSGEAPRGSTGLPSLDGARREAESVHALLQQQGYECQLSLEEDNGVDVITKLYKRSFRVLHIAGHGVYEHPTRQGDRRTGVVLSSGLLITAAEIESMEVVPDLVFLNCCHLATVKREVVAFNRLAASVSRQLIEMGVRAVVACGWAVDDAAAVDFAQTFYGAMLNGTPFGEAVFQARKAAHAAAPKRNTWGAYQAYGDPSYQLENPQDGPSSLRNPVMSPEVRRWEPVAPVELIDQLKQLELRIARDADPNSRAETVQSDLLGLLGPAPERHLANAEIAMAVADVYAAFGGEQREDAYRTTLEAIHNHQRDDGLSIRALEQLANLEARLGERNDDEVQVQRAIDRLKTLLKLVSVDPSDPADTSAAAAPAEWQALLASACKRLAALRARRLSPSPGSSGGQALDAVMLPLKESIAAYGRAGQVNPYDQLHHLALRAVEGLLNPPDAGTLQDARTLTERLRDSPQDESSFWSAIALADALLVCSLLDRRLGAEGDPGDEAAREVEQAYRDAFTTLRNTPLERESALEHLALLADLVNAFANSGSDPCPTCVAMGARLRAMAQALQEPAHADAPGPGTGGGEDVIEVLG